MTTRTQMWTYDSTLDATGNQWIGFDVHATDGDIGKIDEMTAEAGRSCVVVDTGAWIFGKKRLIPASAVTSVDPANKRVDVRLTKDQIKDAPDFKAIAKRKDAADPDDSYYEEYGSYYGRHI